MSCQGGSLGRLASLFVGWLLGRASRETFKQTLEAARLAVVGDPRESALARELREFVAGYVGGGIATDRTDRSAPAQR